MDLAFGDLGVADSRNLGLLYSAAPESDDFTTVYNGACLTFPTLSRRSFPSISSNHRFTSFEKAFGREPNALQPRSTTSGSGQRVVGYIW